MELGNRLKQRRLELGISVDELAKKINKNRATIYRYENSEIENIPATIVQKLAEVLQTTPVSLMGYDEIILSDFEKKLILKYRANPQMHEAVHKILGIE